MLRTSLVRLGEGKWQKIHGTGFSFNACLDFARAILDLPCSSRGFPQDLVRLIICSCLNSYLHLTACLPVVDSLDFFKLFLMCNEDCS